MVFVVRGQHMHAYFTMWGGSKWSWRQKNTHNYVQQIGVYHLSGFSSCLCKLKDGENNMAGGQASVPVLGEYCLASVKSAVEGSDCCVVHNLGGGESASVHTVIDVRVRPCINGINISSLFKWVKVKSSL